MRQPSLQDEPEIGTLAYYLNERRPLPPGSVMGPRYLREEDQPNNQPQEPINPDIYDINPDIHNQCDINDDDLISLSEPI